MTHTASRLRAASTRSVAAVLIAASALLAGCESATEVETPALTTFVRVLNSASVDITNIEVLTAADATPIKLGKLSAGETSAETAVTAVHDFPVVTATVNGKSVTLHPVEGFSGFNPKRAPGRYTLVLKYTEASGFDQTLTTQIDP